VQGRFLTGAWRHLAMMNWVVEPELLEPLVPAGTKLDRFDGRVWISLVGFLFADTRLLGLPIPFHTRFEEVNLRFYVRRVEPTTGEVKRAVVFVREIVPRAAIALTARLAYNEAYVAHPMSHTVELPQDGGRGVFEYGWRARGESYGMRVETIGTAGPIEAGSEAEFITEHYWGYVRQRDGSTYEYQVEHPRWDVWNADSAALIGPVPAYYGAPFESVLASPPVSSFVAAGSAIVVRKPRRI
jgi:uncharacterized protein YqjF (DUF2071 family)